MSVAAALFVALTLGPQADPPSGREVAAEINRARTDPRGYARLLRRHRQAFDGLLVRRPDGGWLQTTEGAPAVDEAIAFLERQPPLSPLADDPRLTRMASGHVRDQGETGGVGHAGRDGAGVRDRARRAGWTAGVGEFIDYGAWDARSVVVNLIVDDAVPDRGHRRAIFQPGYRFVGADCGAHPTYRLMCVANFGR